MKMLLLSTLTVFVLLALSGCNQSPQKPEPHYEKAPLHQQDKLYKMAVHPLYNPQQLYIAYQPLIDYLNRNVDGVKLELEASRDYSSFEGKIKERTAQILLPNPLQTLLSIKSGYSVIAMAGEPKDFKGIFVVRSDSGIRYPSDLKGKSVSYPASTALAGCIMPQYFLYSHGIDINKDIENKYVGSQESSIMNVYVRKTAAGATWPPPWRVFQKEHPREASELKVVWETPSLISNSVMVRNDLPARLRQQVRSALLRLNDTQAGRAILAGMETSRFYPAVNDDYEVVRRYIARFEQEVRQVTLK